MSRFSNVVSTIKWDRKSPKNLKQAMPRSNSYLWKLLKRHSNLRRNKRSWKRICPFYKPKITVCRFNLSKLIKINFSCLKRSKAYRQVYRVSISRLKISSQVYNSNNKNWLFYRQKTTLWKIPLLKWPVSSKTTTNLFNGCNAS